MLFDLQAPAAGTDEAAEAPAFPPGIRLQFDLSGRDSGKRNKGHFHRA